jgi:predicted secreted protein
VTNVAAAPSVTITINGKDTASGKYYLLLAGAAVTTAVTNRYVIAPDATATANVSAKDYVPTVFQIVVTANNANAGTYSVGYNLLRN